MPGKVTCTIDGEKFNPVEATFEINSDVDGTGMPASQTLAASVHIRVDLSQGVDFPFQRIKTFFNLSNLPTTDKIKTMKVEFWKGNEKDKQVVCSYTFSGWISSFRTSSFGGESGGQSFDHVLDMVLTPVLNAPSHPELRIGN
jgi:hypothetical protein